MSRTFLLGCACCALLLAEGFPIKPGLWDVTSSSSAPGGAMSMVPPEELAKLTPEQRARIEAAMSGALNNTRKQCYTQEQLAKGPTFDDGKTQNCKYVVASSSGRKMVINFSCDNSGTRTDGQIGVEAPDPEHYNGNVVIHAASNGRKTDMNIKLSGKWLGPDCGSVKPSGN